MGLKQSLSRLHRGSQNNVMEVSGVCSPMRLPRWHESPSWIHRIAFCHAVPDGKGHINEQLGLRDLAVLDQDVKQ